MNKIIRTICLFKQRPEREKDEDRIEQIAHKLSDSGYGIQTKRVCFAQDVPINNYNYSIDEVGYGIMSQEQFRDQFEAYTKNKAAVNIDLTSKEILLHDVEILFDVINGNPSKTFEFNYGFNLPSSSPYFPSANFEKEGFAIGLQPTDLSENCQNLQEWFENIKKIWNEIAELFQKDKNFLGIDSSIASLYHFPSSLIGFIKRIGDDFNHSVTTDIFTQITNFIKAENPKPIGLCGLMFPCLEDFELAEEYEKGNFSIERNIFLSLHSGLGIDTYPIGTDESKERILEILVLIQSLSNKYKKPLSVRFVSDGKAKIGDKTDFKNIYLKDVVIRKL